MKITGISHKLRTIGKVCVYPVLVGVTMALVLGFSVDEVFAKSKKKDKEESFDEWVVLGSGFLGRRNVPENFGLEITERKHDSVQVNEKYLRVLLKEAKKDKDKKAQKQIKAQIKQLKQFKKGYSGINRSASALWLGTEEEGIYGVSVTELADKLGVKEKNLKKAAKNKEFSIRNAGKSVPWYYDKPRKVIMALLIGEFIRYLSKQLFQPCSVSMHPPLSFHHRELSPSHLLT